MPSVIADIPTSLKTALDAEVARIKGSASSVITASLAQYLGTPIHTLFQVSTSGALVAGVYSGVVNVKAVLDHGDFGLGTFGPVESLRDFASRCDAQRLSGNIFYAFRLDGWFSGIRTRAVSPPGDGKRLIDAAKAQSEFHFKNLAGTLVGLWSPGFSSAFSVPGYHFHFLSEGCQHGGHLLDCAAGPLRLRMEALTNFHLALPEIESFLKADLSRNAANELAYAEQAMSITATMSISSRWLARTAFTKHRHPRRTDLRSLSVLPVA